MEKRIFFISVLLCLLVNLLNNNPLSVAIINSAIFSGYLFLFFSKVGFPPKFKLVPLLAFIPLFSFKYRYFSAFILESFILLFFWLFLKAKSKFNKWLLLIGLALVCFFSTLLAASIISYRPFSVDWERLFYPRGIIELEVVRQQKESLYLPYPLRSLVFSYFNAYFYLFWVNLFSLISLDNLYRSLLLVNLYFLALALLRIKPLKKEIRTPLLWSLLAGLTAASLVYYPDTLTSFAIARGPLLLLILWGIYLFKQKSLWYYSFWLLSLLLAYGLAK